MKKRIAVAVALACSALLGAAAQPTDADKALVQPVPRAKVSQSAQVELGKMLFFDPRLSRSGFISCNSCHNLSMGGSDNLKTSIGDHWQKGPINSPTVLNSSLNVAQFWDGRARDLREQAGGPIANPGEMASSHTLAVEMLRSIPQYVAEFQTVFGHDRLTIEEVTAAIAAFEETLVTPGARFDKWLAGDTKVLTSQELRGWELFKTSGCVACHNGVNMGGQTFQRMGVVEAYKTDNPAEGRFAVTGKDADRFNFKVPTLRNVALTYPYFHDGAADTLTQAVDTMGRIQLGRKFTPEENADIVSFLHTLTGEQPRFPMPQLPPSSDATRRPQPFDK